ncbi:MAG: alpha/beta fold hydrolase, partial [Flavobacteriales bacterium]|nr:alpha/beta fold hydrolase [Flavobacteriales bacterium]
MKEIIVVLVLLCQTIQTMATIDTVNKEVNGMVFRCRVAGDPTHEPVLLLHGWPETSHMWVQMMEKLSTEGYYCVAPDQRGFSPGARPTKVKDYAIQFLVGDVIGLADAFGM